MPEFEQRQLSNMLPNDIYGSVIANDSFDGLSLVDRWQKRGITFEFTDPVATNTYSAEELKAFGLVGVSISVPKTEAAEPTR